MASGTVLFVHGTGVRFKDYKPAFDAARKLGARVGVEGNFIECVWGDPLGVVFTGLSLPEPPSERQLREEEEDLAIWKRLFDAPLSELHNLPPANAKTRAIPAPPESRRNGKRFGMRYRFTSPRMISNCS